MIALKKHIFPTFFTILIGILTSCAPYKFPTEAITCQTDEKVSSCQRDALSHPLYHIVPRHRCQIRWYDFPHWGMWMLFGNDDDGIFGEGPHAHYRPKEAVSFKKACKWWVRNPLHNLCFYVIGSAHRKNSELQLIKISPTDLEGFYYSPEPATEFPSKNACFYTALHGGKPYVSLRLVYPNRYHSDFYFGWRCRGNFGIKCILLTKDSKE